MNPIILTISQTCTWFLAIQMIFFGLNGFFQWIQNPTPPPDLAKALTSIQSVGYILTTTKLIEILAGILMLFSRTKLIGLFLLAPIVFHIGALHILYNLRKSWIIGIQVLLPFILAFYSEIDKLIQLIN